MKAKILIRLDDICPTMDYAQFQRAEEILRRFRIKPLLGVVPECMDPELMIEPPHADFWDTMKALRSEGYAIAMHGYQHLMTSPHRGLVNIGNKSEFAGLPLEEQCEKLRKGREIMRGHGLDTDCFFAPAHSYDKNTLKALDLCGFRYMSDGKSGKAVAHGTLIALPCRTGGAPKVMGSGYHTAVFHPLEWRRTDKAANYEVMKRFCERYHNDIVDFEEYCRQSLGNPSVQALEERLYVALWVRSARVLCGLTGTWVVRGW